MSRRDIAFWILVVMLAMLLFASSVPSPLYVVYQQEWGFSAITLTEVFAVYALALLAALLVFGSISDHIGRRPTLLAGLVVEILAMLAFAGANGVGWLYVARILQGLATGTAMGALSAALLDLQPRSRPGLGALMGAGVARSRACRPDAGEAVAEPSGGNRSRDLRVTRVPSGPEPHTGYWAGDVAGERGHRRARARPGSARPKRPLGNPRR